MINKDFFLALEELEAQKGINKEYFIDALESALTSAYKKNFGEGRNALVKLNPDNNSIKVYSYKLVVEEVTDPDKEISLADAKLIKKSAKIGDEIDRTEVTPKNFGRIAAQTAKQVVMQRLREAERVKIMGEINTKQDELITVVVRRIEGDNVYCDLGITECEGVLGPKDRIPNEKFVLNSRIKVYVKTIRESFNMPYVQLSRTNVGFVKKLFELEVPEIANGEVVIHNMVREAGYRTKLAVSSPNPTLDAVGACVGNKGMRVASIISELKGEKVDIVPYSENPAEFIAGALSPATILHIELNYNDKTSLVIVPDDKLSLAIGKSGQNVRLAARLTGWKIDVKAKSAVPSLNFDDVEGADESDVKDLFEDNSAFEDLE
ncbi:MAG: transcription termination/antitermination protein NusA [Clostridiales bacterium]|nr:transcription termination/antitermination protein NusA [Clostridiales bacterium]